MKCLNDVLKQYINTALAIIKYLYAETYFVNFDKEYQKV